MVLGVSSAERLEASLTRKDGFALAFMVIVAASAIPLTTTPERGLAKAAFRVESPAPAISNEPPTQSDVAPVVETDFEAWQVADLFEQMMAGPALEYGDPIDQLLEFAIDNMSRPGESQAFSVHMLTAELNRRADPVALTLRVGLCNHGATAERVEGRLSFEVDGHEIYATSAAAENVGRSGAVLSVHLDFDRFNPIHQQLRHADKLKPVFRVRHMANSAAA